MDTKKVLTLASAHLQGLSGHVFDVLTLSKPASLNAAVNLSKVISKLSPLLGNLIEFSAVEFLNEQPEYKGLGKWLRQDPGFPDTIFAGSIITPAPGFEIKAWFPLATEITARFKDSQNHFREDQTNVCMLAWLPNRLIFGKPEIIDVCIVSGRSVAAARDNHYHNPPDYLVMEPEDTTARTRNLQQTNTNGYKWQGTSSKQLKRRGIWSNRGALKAGNTSRRRNTRRSCVNSLAALPIVSIRTSPRWIASFILVSRTSRNGCSEQPFTE